ncbi:MAG: amidohydrolase family protein, partial [Phycisphaerales bacterium]
GYEAVDLNGASVYPGLIAPWTQLGLTEIQAVGQTHDLSENGGVTPEVCPAHAVNPDSTLIPVTRSNGVLLAGIFPQGSPFPGQVSVIRLDGWTVSDMEVRGYVGQVCRWPNMRTVTAWWMDRSEDDQRRDISTQLESITKTLDVATRYRDGRAADPAAPIDLRWEAMGPILPPAQPNSAESQSLGEKPVFMLANDQDQINAAVSYAEQHGLRVVIVGGRDAAECAELLKKNNVPVIVTGTHVFPRRDDAPYDDGYTLPARLAAAGVRFAIANSDDTAHERNLPYSVALAVAHGLEADAGLRAITLSAAEILGISETYGSLDAGKSATLLITTGSPLEVRTQITSAYIDGRKIDLRNKQTDLAEKYEERYRQLAK